MALQQSMLGKFKSEVGNNFNEHNLENILFEFYQGDKYFIKNDKELYIAGAKRISTNTTLGYYVRRQKNYS
jgi:hypothetical protein